MNVAISNVAWPSPLEPNVADLLEKLSVTGVEVAPTAIWPRPTECTDRELDEYRQFWERRGIRIVATQALLFGRPDLVLFDEPATRARTLAYVREMIRVSGRLGASAMVFGSPRNRLRGTTDMSTALEIAGEFFHALGRYAVAEGTHLCIEANAPDYGCDFIQTTQEAVALVQHVDHPGFRLHLDTSTMALNGEDYDDSIAAAVPVAAHCHLSEPNLAPVGGDGVVDHARISGALAAAGYAHWVSVEMRAAESDQALDVVRETLEFVLRQYGDGAPR